MSEYFCDNPECINHQKRDTDEIRIKEHGSDQEKVIVRFEVIDRNGEFIHLCTSCRNSIMMVGGFITYASTTDR